MSEKKYRFTIERPVLCWKYETIVLDADSKEEALEMCKEDTVWYASDITDEWDVERYEDPEIIDMTEIIPRPAHRICDYCGKQPGIVQSSSGYTVRCVNPDCTQQHPAFCRSSEAAAFAAWDAYWEDHDKVKC